MFHIHDRHALFSGSDIGVGAGHVEVARVCELNHRAGHAAWAEQIGNVQHLESLRINHERVAELDGEATWLRQKRGADFRHDPGLQRVIEVNHHQTAIAEYIGEGPGDGDAARAGQRASRIESRGPLRENCSAGLPSSSVPTPGLLPFRFGSPTITRPSYLIGYIEEAIHEMNALFFVLLAMACAGDQPPALWASPPPSHTSWADKSADPAEIRAP